MDKKRMLIIIIAVLLAVLVAVILFAVKISRIPNVGGNENATTEQTYITEDVNQEDSTDDPVELIGSAEETVDHTMERDVPTEATDSAESKNTEVGQQNENNIEPLPEITSEPADTNEEISTESTSEAADAKEETTITNDGAQENESEVPESTYETGIGAGGDNELPERG